MSWIWLSFLFEWPVQAFFYWLRSLWFSQLISIIYHIVQEKKANNEISDIDALNALKDMKDLLVESAKQGNVNAINYLISFQ